MFYAVVPSLSFVMLLTFFGAFVSFLCAVCRLLRNNQTSCFYTGSRFCVLQTGVHFLQLSECQCLCHSCASYLY
jgi:hypothetical protein